MSLHWPDSLKEWGLASTKPGWTKSTSDPVCCKKYIQWKYEYWLTKLKESGNTPYLATHNTKCTATSIPHFLFSLLSSQSNWYCLGCLLLCMSTKSYQDVDLVMQLAYLKVLITGLQETTVKRHWRLTSLNLHLWRQRWVPVMEKKMTLDIMHIMKGLKKIIIH